MRVSLFCPQLWFGVRSLHWEPDGNVGERKVSVLPLSEEAQNVACVTKRGELQPDLVGGRGTTPINTNSDPLCHCPPCPMDSNTLFSHGGRGFA